jgi:hypothetical protein
MDQKKVSVVILLFMAAPLIAILFFHIAENMHRNELSYAPKIRKEDVIDDLDVRRISFDRGSLFLNKKRYDCYISFFTKVHSQDSIFSFKNMPPPFLIRKEANNDTLEIIKDDRKFYIILSEPYISNQLLN